MSISSIPREVLDRFQIEEHRHACTILAEDHPTELGDLLACLRGFELLRSEIIVPGGNKTKIAQRIEKLFHARGWQEEESKIEIKVNDRIRVAKTHSIDLCRGRVACEIQWNSKDGVFSRDLATLRLLHELDVISLGIIITRCDELQKLFVALGNGTDGRPLKSKYGASTTHWSKLVDRISNSDAGMCPVLMIGIRRECYRDDLADQPPIPRKPKPRQKQ